MFKLCIVILSILIILLLLGPIIIYFIDTSNHLYIQNIFIYYYVVAQIIIMLTALIGLILGFFYFSKNKELSDKREITQLKISFLYKILDELHNANQLILSFSSSSNRIDNKKILQHYEVCYLLLKTVFSSSSIKDKIQIFFKIYSNLDNNLNFTNFNDFSTVVLEYEQNYPKMIAEIYTYMNTLSLK